MTLSNAEVIKYLNRRFVSGWRNIKGKTPYAGSSNTHLPTNAAMQVNNFAGNHNIQMFFMTGDGRVLHCLPGYWSPKHFLHEAKFAEKLANVYYVKNLSAAKRNEKYLDLHLTHAYTHSHELQYSSQLQGFDKKHVEKHTKDYQREKGFRTGLKTSDQVMHERLAALPFIPFEKFDTATYINMGRPKYKYDYGLAKYGKKDGKKGEGCKCGSSCKCTNCRCATR